MKDILNYGFPATDADGNPIRMSLSETDEAKLTKDIANKERDIQLLERDVNTLFTDNGNFKKIIRSIKENIQENKNLIIQHNKSINDNLQKYREIFLTQNQNKMVVEEQRPNETQHIYNE
jgi:hypothetical protein